MKQSITVYVVDTLNLGAKRANLRGARPRLSTE